MALKLLYYILIKIYRRAFKMNFSNKTYKRKSSLDIWSMERIGRLITGVITAFFLLAGLLMHPLFLYLLLILSFHSIYTTITDSCPFEKLLRRIGGKQREELFQPNGEPIQNQNCPK